MKRYLLGVATGYAVGGATILGAIVAEEGWRGLRYATHDDVVAMAAMFVLWPGFMLDSVKKAS